uniref:Uncharacterized protein n=1 Tax=Glossina palpalis gambiensis TaxID=67801 RepID=A0A1B0BUU4_9MUSC
MFFARHRMCVYERTQGAVFFLNTPSSSSSSSANQAFHDTQPQSLSTQHVYYVPLNEHTHYVQLSLQQNAISFISKYTTLRNNNKNRSIFDEDDNNNEDDDDDESL